ncbi:MAG: DUF3795 domain-containing protein, partial [Planctomycetes bacterium]|nr:DUF3795 domain-containing protein [Planctomycetota bacterium]
MGLARKNSYLAPGEYTRGTVWCVQPLFPAVYHGFRTCAAQREVTWCFQCGEFPCDRLRAFSTEHV